MKAFVLESYRQKPILKDVPVPKPKENEALIQVYYCGVNRVELGILSGRFGQTIPFPLIMGAEITGKLPNGRRVAVNPYLHCGKCPNCKKRMYLYCLKGRPLIGVQKNGGYAEFTAVPKTNLIPIPDNITFQDATAISLSGGTAYRMVFSKVQIAPHQNVVITAAGSGVGVYSVQFANLTTNNVFGIASGQKKIKKLKALGIKYAFNAQHNNWLKSFIEYFKKDGIDVLIDTVGGNTLETITPLVNPDGSIVFCGATESPNISLNMIDIYTKQKRLIGSSGFMNKDLKDIFQLLKKKKVVAVIDSIYPLQGINSALEKLSSRNVFGKIIIKVY